MTTNKRFNRKCMVCSAAWNHDDWFRAQGHGGCPSCKTKIAPMNIAHNGYIELNWSELIMLATYAKRWSKIVSADSELAVQTIMVLENILKRLSKYRPDGAFPLYPENDPIEISIEKQLVTPEMPAPDDTGRVLSPFYQPKNK